MRELTKRAADDTPWIVVPAELLAIFQGQVSGVETITIDLAAPARADVRTMDGRPFAAAFEDAFGYTPTSAVFAGYGAARQIDKAVHAGN